MPDTPSRTAHTADFTFRVGDLATDVLKVTAFEGTEGISELFHFHVDLCSDESTVDFATVIGKPCVLRIDGTHGSRYVNGIIRRFERVGEGVNLTYYAAEIVPVHWLLTRRHRSRIFQEMSVPDIVEKVLTDAGIPTDNFRFALQGTYNPQEYVVQYRESEHAFISRLAEEVGIFYFFEHTEDGHKMVFADSGVAHVDTPNQAEVPYRAPTGLVSEAETEYLLAVRDQEQIRTGAVSLDDFDFQKPPTQLRAEVAAEQYSSLQFQDYPGEYTERSDGQGLAQVRLEEFQCARRTQHMNGTVRSLLPGYKFTLMEHPSEALNQEYIVTRLEHRARRPQSAEDEAATAGKTQYEVDVRTIVAEIPFRPPRKTPRPTVLGSQTALVVGPSGEEIYTDEYGRVKVQFHWDQEGQYNEESSCWIRVSQGSAGGQYGLMFLPRVGHEVVVDFLEGNPDQPIITGRVYNNDLMPPYTLPDEKTKSVIKTHSSKGGGGTNEIRFEDLKDKEQLFIQAQRQMDTRVKASHYHTVCGSYHLRIGGNDEGELREYVEDAKHVHIKGSLITQTDTDESHTVDGKVSIKVDGTQSVEIGSDVIEKFGANHKHEVTSTYALKATAVKIEATSGIELKCGGSSICLTPGAIFIQAPITNINSGSGPPVGPVTAMPTSPDPVEDPGSADQSEPGYDVTYDPDAAEYEELELEEPGEPPEEEETEEETSWIEIEMIDEANQPCAGERYEIQLPNGKIRRGSLDANGHARLDGIQPGTCQVRFPRLDSAAWERI